jgi:2-keto-4-pentenoate hydratase/2-oxohepta-3-ene-1,7-dioic acid hydratase in catechol pathway
MARYQMGSCIVAGRERIILSTHGSYIDLLAVLHTDGLRKEFLQEESEIPASLLEIIQKWSFWQERLPWLVDSWLTQRGQIGGELREEEIGWLPPLMYPGKLICIGANYGDHAAEMGGRVRLRNPIAF